MPRHFVKLFQEEIRREKDFLSPVRQRLPSFQSFKSQTVDTHKAVEAYSYPRVSLPSTPVREKEVIYRWETGVQPHTQENVQVSEIPQVHDSKEELSKGEKSNVSLSRSEGVSIQLWCMILLSIVTSFVCLLLLSMAIHYIRKK
jgi:hypothetical protein